MSGSEVGPISPRFEFSGGAVCLDFANTLGDPRPGAADKLDSIDDLLDWAGEGGLISPSELRRLAAEAGRRTVTARRVFRRAIRLREAIYRIFSATAAGVPPPVADVESINAALPRALANLRIAAGRDGCRWTWAPRREALDSPLWPVLRSAAGLLTSPDAQRVRECSSDSCRWLFLDRSRGGRRRWCDMKTCGNRAKARRHYRRTKARRRGKERG